MSGGIYDLMSALTSGAFQICDLLGGAFMT